MLRKCDVIEYKYDEPIDTCMTEYFRASESKLKTRNLVISSPHDEVSCNHGAAKER